MAKHKHHKNVQAHGFGKNKKVKKPSVFQMYRSSILISAVIFFVAGLVAWKIVQSSNNPQSGNIASSTKQKTQRTGLPKMIDLGTTSCTPCKMMIPVMEELESNYSDQMIVEFINTAENPEKSSEYGISVIPTQIFYDKKGKELTRHTGFISKEDIFSTFLKYGITIN